MADKTSFPNECDESCCVDLENESRNICTKVNTSGYSTRSNDNTVACSCLADEPSSVDIAPTVSPNKICVKPILYQLHSKTRRRQMLLLGGILMLVLTVIGFSVYFVFKFTRRRSTNHIYPEELALNNNPKTNCWLVLYDNVYDLTEYATEHIGGPDWIWDYCGKVRLPLKGCVEMCDIVTMHF